MRLSARLASRIGGPLVSPQRLSICHVKAMVSVDKWFSTGLPIRCPRSNRHRHRKVIRPARGTTAAVLHVMRSIRVNGAVFGSGKGGA